MIDAFNKRLIFFLISKDKSNKDHTNINEFISLLKEDKIPIKLVRYLYNYLYTNTSFSNISIDVEYDNNKVILEESFDKKGIITIKESKISLSDSIGDIKRKTRIIKSGDKEEKYNCKKSIHYSMDSNIDLVVLEAQEEDIFSIDDVKDYFIDKEDDYSKISFIDIHDPKKYYTMERKGDYIDEYTTYMSRGKLVDENFANKMKDNYSMYTRNSYLRLYELYKNNSYENNYKITYDYDNEKIIEDEDKYLLEKINKDNDSYKIFDIVKKNKLNK